MAEGTGSGARLLSSHPYHLLSHLLLPGGGEASGKAPEHPGPLHWGRYSPPRSQEKRGIKCLAHSRSSVCSSHISGRGLVGRKEEGPARAWHLGLALLRVWEGTGDSEEASFPHCGAHGSRFPVTTAGSEATLQGYTRGHWEIPGHLARPTHAPAQGCPWQCGLTGMAEAAGQQPMVA